MRHDVHFAARATLAEASALIATFGDYARSEAAERARRSRDLGNVSHFCLWRDVERMIDMLADTAVTGPRH